MSREQKSQTPKYVALGVLGVAALGILGYQMMNMMPAAPPPPPADANAASAEATPGAPASTAPAAGSPAAGSPAAQTVQSRFQRSNVNLDELIAKIQDIDFDYDVDKVDVDPFRPLVGPMAPAQFAVQTGTSGPGLGAMELFLRSVSVTGIIMNPNRPLAVVNYRDMATNQDASEVAYIGFMFPNTGVYVEDIKPERIVLRANDIAVPIELKER
ncbi:MAG: hypothetical protein AMXMBFR84_37030 [Candidatus Hydrogenedentota bacterium]